MFLRTLCTIVATLLIPSLASADRSHIDNRGSDANAVDTSPTKRYGKTTQIGGQLDRLTYKADDFGFNTRVLQFGAALQPTKNVGVTAALGQSARMGDSDLKDEDFVLGVGGAFQASPLQLGLGLNHVIHSEDYDYGSFGTKAEYSRTLITLGASVAIKKFRAGLIYTPQVVTKYTVDNTYDDSEDDTDKQVDVDAERIRAFGSAEFIKNLSLQLTIERSLAAEEEVGEDGSSYSIRLYASTAVTVGGWYLVAKEHRLLASVGRTRTDNDESDGYNLTTLGYDWILDSCIASVDILYAKLTPEATATGFKLGYTHKL